jgi:tellurite resistance protein TerC
MTAKRAILNVAFWVTLSLVINLGIYLTMGRQAAAEYFGAWAMEQALSLDNLFMFYFVFKVFRTPRESRPRVLAWGVAGVIIMRGLIIIGGTTLIAKFQPLIWMFALFLVWAAFKIFALHDDHEPDQEEVEASLRKNWLVRVATKVIPFQPEYHGDRFVVRKDGKVYGTMLLLTLLAVEGTDVPFAFDSLPAAMAMSDDWRIILTSNLLAVCGLRSLYFLIENMQERFSHMRYGIGFLLAFAAFKIIAADYGAIAHALLGWIPIAGIRTMLEGLDPHAGLHLPLWLALGIIVAAIAATIGYTLWASRARAPV